MNFRSIRFRLTAWYAILLASMVFAFSSVVYLGLQQYLITDLSNHLSSQARQIGDTWLRELNRAGKEYVINEIDEHLAPVITNRFIRLSGPDGSLFYQSKPPRDGSFDPVLIPRVKEPQGAVFRKERLRPQTELLIYSLPYSLPGAGSFLIEVGASYNQIKTALQGLMTIFALILPVALVLAASGGYVLMKRALQPVDEIARAAETITSQNLSERLPIPGTKDEIERLSATLNRMIERLERSFLQIVQFTADASHELRTPLTVLRAELEVLVRKNSLPPETREVVGSVLEETERLSKIVEHLMILSRLDSGELKIERVKFELGDFCRETVEQMHLLAEDKAIHLECAGLEPVEVNADPLRIRQILINLIDNAIQHTPAGGRVCIVTAKQDAHARIEVTDTGEGIPKEALPYIFNRFYRLDKARAREHGGSGLGLAIAKAICELHGGRINAESEEGAGARFRVELPFDLR